MKMKMKMEIISEELIKPSQPTPINLVHQKPSVFDRISDPIFMPFIFFYTKQHTHTTDTILDRLKISLPATLSVFYPLAGRVELDTNYYIVCNDEGVPYVEAKLHSTCLSEIVHKADVSVLDKFLPYYDTSLMYSKVLLAIQVTTFACGGLAIGIKFNHTMSDAFSIAMFLKTWTAIAKGDNDTYTLPCFDIWRQFPLNESEFSKWNFPEEPNSDLMERLLPVTKWFMFSKAACEALRSKICLDLRSASLTMILSAFIWSRVMLACRSDVKSIPQKIFQVVNFRSKVKPPSESCYYYGNMVANAIAVPNHNGNTSLYDTYLTSIDKSFEKMIGKRGVFIEELQNGKQDLGYVTEYFEKKNKGEIEALGFSTLRSLPMYESDFGWGKPVWVTSATLVFKDMVFLIPGGAAGGAASNDTYVYVNLSHDQMVKLQNDHEFLSFVSKSPSCY